MVGGLGCWLALGELPHARQGSAHDHRNRHLHHLLVTVDLHLQLRQRRPRQGATRGAYYRHASIRLFAEVPASARESWQEGSRLVVRGRRPCATSLSVLLLEYLTTPSPHDFQGSGRGSEFPHRP